MDGGRDRHGFNEGSASLLTEEPIEDKKSRKEAVLQ